MQAHEIVQGRDFQSAYRNGIAVELAYRSVAPIRLMTVDESIAGPLEYDRIQMRIRGEFPNAFRMDEIKHWPGFTVTLNLNGVDDDIIVLSDGSTLSRLREEFLKAERNVEVRTIASESDLRRAVINADRQIVINAFTIIGDFGNVLQYSQIERKVLSYKPEAIGLCVKSSSAMFSLGPSEKDWASAILSEGELTFRSCVRLSAVESLHYEEHAGGYDEVKAF